MEVVRVEVAQVLVVRVEVVRVEVAEVLLVKVEVAEMLLVRVEVVRMEVVQSGMDRKIQSWRRAGHWRQGTSVTRGCGAPGDGGGADRRAARSGKCRAASTRMSGKHRSHTRTRRTRRCMRHTATPVRPACNANTDSRTPPSRRHACGSAAQ